MIDLQRAGDSYPVPGHEDHTGGTTDRRAPVRVFFREFAGLTHPDYPEHGSRTKAYLTVDYNDYMVG